MLFGEIFVSHRFCWIFAFPSARGRRKGHIRIFIQESRKKDNPLEAVMLQGVMAESMGFEPTNRLWRLHDFQSCSFDQLGQLSNCSNACLLYLNISKKSSPNFKKYLTVKIRLSQAETTAFRVSDLSLLNPHKTKKIEFFYKLYLVIWNNVC